jgi:hypothetical protein
VVGAQHPASQFEQLLVQLAGAKVLAAPPQGVGQAGEGVEGRSLLRADLALEAAVQVLVGLDRRGGIPDSKEHPAVLTAGGERCRAVRPKGGNRGR